MLHARQYAGVTALSSFTLNLQDAFHHERFDRVESFVGEDGSGSFGILANHDRFMTSMSVGLSRFRNNDDWRYIASPGALLYFVGNVLTISTRRFIVDDDYERISTTLQVQLLDEEKDLQAMRDNLQRMEDEMLKRLSKLGRVEE